MQGEAWEDLALFGDRREWVGRFWMRTSASLPFSPRPAGRTRGAHPPGRRSGPTDLGRLRSGSRGRVPLRPCSPRASGRRRPPVGREGGATHRPGSAGRSRLRSTGRLSGGLPRGRSDRRSLPAVHHRRVFSSSTGSSTGKDAAPTGGWRIHWYLGRRPFRRKPAFPAWALESVDRSTDHAGELPGQVGPVYISIVSVVSSE